MRRFVFFLRLCTVAITLVSATPSARTATLRYTVTANVSGIVFGTALPNCALNACSITITGVGDSANAVAFPVVCVSTSCFYKGTGGGGFWNRSLTNVTVTVYDPIAGVTYGPAALPSGFFVAFDNFNGGIGFGSDGYGGPAYPVSIVFPGGAFAYQYLGLSSSYDLTTPVLVGGTVDNCPAPGLGCDTTPLPPIPITLADGTTVPLSAPRGLGFLGQFWVEEEPPSNHWIAAASMLQPRSAHTATVLTSGKVLVVGGQGGATAALTSEIYDPSSDSWMATAAPSCGRTSHTATLLADGRVLVVGGTVCPKSAEIFDPQTQTWSAAAPIPIAYPGPTVALLLQDHRILVAGSNGAEIYDATANSWNTTSGLTPLSTPVGALLPSGSAVILDNGNCTGGLPSPLSTQIFNPATSTWTAGAAGPACSNSTLTATALATGNALVTGMSLNGNVEHDYAPIGWWSLYNPTANTWGGTQYGTLDVLTLPMGGNEVPQLLSDGQVLLVGGNALVAQPTILAPAPTVQLRAPISPLFDPATGLWTPKPAPAVGRTGHAVVTLQSGEVLAIGGQAIAPGLGALASVERLISGAISQTITVGTLPAIVFGGTGTLMATASSGLPVSFASDTPQTCSVSVSVVTGLLAGTCSITASQAGNASYSAAPQVVFSFPIAPAPQAISFGPLPASIPVFGSLALSATASSGLSVQFSSASPLICAVSGTSLTGLAGGTCTVVANQNGNANVLPAAPIAHSLNILKLPQVIEFPRLREPLEKQASIILNVAASSGLPVSLESETPTVCHLRGKLLLVTAEEGTCIITANQGGNAQYLAAPQVVRKLRLED